MSTFNKMAAWIKVQKEAVSSKLVKLDMKEKIGQSKWYDKSKHTLLDTCHKVKALVVSRKKEAIISVVTLTTIVSGAGVGHTYYQANVETVYHVFLHDKEIGIVNDKEVISQWVDNKLKEEASRFGHVQFAENTIVFKPEEAYKPGFDNEEALNRLESEFSLMADALQVVVDGEFIGYVADEESLNTILDAIKGEFVSQEFLATQNQSKDEKNRVLIASVDEGSEAELSTASTQSNENELPLNEPKIVDAQIKQDIQLARKSVHPSMVLSAEQLEEKLTGSKVEEMIHVVEEGEVLGTIAEKYGLKLSELLALNPGITEDSLIKIGQELKVKGNEPLITVQTVEKVKREESIKFTVETKTDAKMYKGESRVTQEGKNGKKIVEYTIVKENGRVVNKVVDSEQIIEQPVNRIIVRGEKVKPSRGEGKFSWPAVGGFVTSGYGQRWGRLHGGIDIAGVKDKTIKAADTGKVTTAGWDRYFGNYVVINHGNGYETLYAHMSSLSVKKGQTVTKGEKLGVMGSTGSSTGVHLHFEIHKNGSRINPINHVRR